MSERLVVVAETPPPQPAGAIMDGPAAVEIAEIQAERDVAIATIDAEIQAETIEEIEDDVEWLRTELTGLHAGHARLNLELTALRTTLEATIVQLSEMAELITLLSIPQPPSPEAEPIAEPSPENAADGLKESGAEPPAPPELPPEPEKKRRRYL